MVMLRLTIRMSAGRTRSGRGQNDIRAELPALVARVRRGDKEANCSDESMSACDDLGFVGSDRKLDEGEILDDLSILPNGKVACTLEGVGRRSKADIVDENAMNQSLRLSTESCRVQERQQIELEF
jgi:hypothetical protein